jgi:1-acyl-sn-glycerol-3-phosphate acyltransferase
MNFLRSALFMVFQMLLTPIVLVAMIVCMPFGYSAMHGLTRMWCRLMLEGARVICGIRYQLQGVEHLPREASVVLSKHQSAWETIFLNWYCPRAVFVIKRELVLVPFFGWGLAMVKPISIDRKAGRDALNQVIEQGKDRLRDGHWVVLFPEGTRVAVGERKRYGIGGASLAVAAGARVVPVAHNAGHVWARNAFTKRPGLITVSFGPSIATQGRTPPEVIGEAEAWIEAEVARLGSSHADEAASVTA